MFIKSTYAAAVADLRGLLAKIGRYEFAASTGLVATARI